jgi:hypothetical protein
LSLSELFFFDSELKKERETERKKERSGDDVGGKIFLQEAPRSLVLRPSHGEQEEEEVFFRRQHFFASP